MDQVDDVTWLLLVELAAPVDRVAERHGEDVPVGLEPVRWQAASGAVADPLDVEVGEEVGHQSFGRRLHAMRWAADVGDLRRPLRLPVDVAAERAGDRQVRRLEEPEGRADSADCRPQPHSRDALTRKRFDRRKSRARHSPQSGRTPDFERGSEKMLVRRRWIAGGVAAAALAGTMIGPSSVHAGGFARPLITDLSSPKGMDVGPLGDVIVAQGAFGPAWAGARCSIRLRRAATAVHRDHRPVQHRRRRGQPARRDRMGDRHGSGSCTTSWPTARSRPC